MELARKFLPLIIFLVQAEESLCTHFRGGTFTYKPVNPSNTTSTKVSVHAVISDSRKQAQNLIKGVWVPVMAFTHKIATLPSS